MIEQQEAIAISQHRVPTEKSKYYIQKEVFLTTLHYCLQYPLWVAELNTVADNRSIRYDMERVQSSGNSDFVADTAIRRAEISRKKDGVDNVAKLVAGDLAQWIISGVCYDQTYYQLAQQGIPCGKDLYYKLRREFYYEMSKRI